jgi:hypothetical protein
MPERRDAPIGINKRYSDMTDRELLDALGYWTLEVEHATAWGAAYGMSCKEQNRAKAEAVRRGLSK